MGAGGVRGLPGSSRGLSRLVGGRVEGGGVGRGSARGRGRGRGRPRKSSKDKGDGDGGDDQTAKHMQILKKLLNGPGGAAGDKIFKVKGVGRWC